MYICVFTEAKFTEAVVEATEGLPNDFNLDAADAADVKGLLDNGAEVIIR